MATHADLSVFEGPLQADCDDPDAATNPVLVVEVVSPLTEAYDRGQKAALYREFDSLREYVLVAQDAPRIEVFRRVEGNRWEFEEARAGDSIRLASVSCTLAVDEIFASP